MNTKPKKQEIDAEVEHILAYLAEKSPESEEYKCAVSNLEILMKARSYKKDRLFSMDTVLIVLGGFAQVFAILNYEKLGVISTKALSTVVKPHV